MKRFIVWILVTLIGGAFVHADDVNLNCGPHCLYIGLRNLDVQIGTFETFYQDQFVKRFGPPDSRGYSLGEIEVVAKAYGMQTQGAKTTLSALSRIQSPVACIAWIHGNHFVLLGSAEEDRVTVIDAPRSYVTPGDTFGKVWDGTVLLLAPTLPELTEGVNGNWGWRMLIACLSVLCISALIIGRIVWRRSHA